MTGRYIGSRLVLSCDLVGSTRRKQGGSDSNDWINVFLQFYRLFPSLFQAALDSRSPGHGLRPRLWKAVGDELVFICDVVSETDIYVLVDAWLVAMNDYEREEASGLTTKGGAFVATFPSPDREVRIARALDASRDTMAAAEVDNEHALLSDESGRLEDFLGPSIDTGFRVMSRATHRYFTLTVEVAWAYAAYLLSKDTSSDALRLHEETPLKGVWKDREYPIFAVDREHTLPVNAALIALRQTPTLQSRDICQLCTACSASDGWPGALYLPDSPSAEFKLKHAELLERAAELDGLRDALENWPIGPEPAPDQGLSDDPPQLPRDLPQS